MKHFGSKSNVLTICKLASLLYLLQVTQERTFSVRRALLYLLLPPASLCQSVTRQCHRRPRWAVTVLAP